MKKHSKIRLYINESFSQDKIIDLNKEQTHYLVNVMRQKAGKEIFVFNGKDGEWLAKIDEVSKKSSTICLIEETRKQDQTSDIWLVFTKIKRGPTEFIVQKATELGATKILSISTKFSDAKEANPSRLKQISIEASEQCERLDLADIIEAGSLEDLIKDWDPERKIIICDESGLGKTAKEVFSKLDKNGKYAVLIGPEGGFSIGELEMIRNLPYVIPVSLGPRILKAETAAITALSCLQMFVGDWHLSPRFDNKE